MQLVDLNYLGQPEVIASALLETPEGYAAVDPGPTTSVEALRAALAQRGATMAELRWLLLTHIHLDHAGATGVLVRENPELRVFVHERGARHLAAPERLLESATRIYGDRMRELWGEFLPVPADHLHALRGGERLELGGRAVRVAATPGHAWHHVSYLDETSGTAFVGDVAGERYPGCDFAIPVTPPPDIDLDVWRDSWEQLRQWNPAALFLTHFGVFTDVVAHLDQLERRTLAARRYAHTAGVLESWTGLARYWRRKTG